MRSRVANGLIVALTLSTGAAVAISQPSGAASGASAGGTARNTGPPVPRTGRAHTGFVIRFSSHAKLGRHRGFALAYDLDVSEHGSHPTVGCEGSFNDSIDRGSRGQHLAFRESPGPDATGWCPGRFRGKVRLVATYPCRLKPSLLDCNPRTKALVGRVSWLVLRPRKR